MLPELLNNVPISGEGTTDAVLFAEPQGDTTAGTAIAYCVKVLTALNDGMDKTALVALSQDILSFILVYHPVVLRSFLYKDITVQPEHYLGVYRVITISEHSAAGTWTERQSFGKVNYFLSLSGGQQVSPLQIPPPGISYPPDQPAYQRYPSPPRPEHVELEGKLTVLTVQPQCMVHPDEKPY